MRALLSIFASGLVLSGCSACQNLPPVSSPNGAGTFQVSVLSVENLDGTAYGPGDGSQGNPFPFVVSTVQMQVFVQAVDTQGLPLNSFNRPVWIRVTPGDLDPTTAWILLKNGQGQGTVRASHVYGGMAVWAKDGPPAPDYVNYTVFNTGYYDAGLGTLLADGGASYTYATGASTPTYFLTPTIAQVQRQSNCDPAQSFPATFTGPCTKNSTCYDSVYGVQYQCYEGYCAGACDSALANLTLDFVEIDQQPPAVDMVVTDITSDGFYVSDLAAEKFYDPANPTITVDFQKLPGTFNSIFVYNYSAPTNLYVGDHLVSLSGTVDMFSGDTQLDFPSWIVVNALPTSDRQPTHELSIEEDCTLSTPSAASDALCGYYTSDYGLKSLESTPVQIVNARPSNIFVDCDFNGTPELPIFANSSTTFMGNPGNWGCYSDQTEGELPECACFISCTTGLPYPNYYAADAGPMGPWPYVDFSDQAPANSVQPICSELSALQLYQQWNVEMYSPDGGTSYPDGGYDGYTEAQIVGYPTHGVRILVDTAQGVPNFDPVAELVQPQYQGITFDIAGMLNHIEAGRPRWLIVVRQPSDVCCHPNIRPAAPGSVPMQPDGGSWTGICPPEVNECIRTAP